MFADIYESLMIYTSLLDICLMFDTDSGNMSVSNHRMYVREEWLFLLQNA